MARLALEGTQALAALQPRRYHCIRTGCRFLPRKADGGWRGGGGGRGWWAGGRGSGLERRHWQRYFAARRSCGSAAAGVASASGSASGSLYPSGGAGAGGGEAAGSRAAGGGPGRAAVPDEHRGELRWRRRYRCHCRCRKSRSRATTGCSRQGAQFVGYRCPQNHVRDTSCRTQREGKCLQCGRCKVRIRSY